MECILITSVCIAHLGLLLVWRAFVTLTDGWVWWASWRVCVCVCADSRWRADPVQGPDSVHHTVHLGQPVDHGPGVQHNRARHREGARHAHHGQPDPGRVRHGHYMNK
eukprot:1193981-Prorocentrum_minimum.AAC.1